MLRRALKVSSGVSATPSLPTLAYCASVACAISIVSLRYLYDIQGILRSDWSLLCAICYLCAISVLSMRPCAGDWFLLCAIYAISCFLCAISEPSL